MKYQIGLSKSHWMVLGRMEFGPRALGARSIIGDPKPKDAKSYESKN